MMPLDIGMLWQYAPLLLSGLGVTLYVSAISALIAVVGGLALALALLSPLAPLRWVARAYVDVMRGTPVLVILFLLYYGGPSVGLTLNPVPAGIVGLGAYAAGYFAEVFRTGFLSIPNGQIEAARMVGMSRAHIVKRVQIPQMMALIVPPATNQIILLIKESALLSIITVAELTKNATQMANETFAVVEPYFGVAVLYWVLIEMVARAGALVERRVRWLA